MAHENDSVIHDERLRLASRPRAAAAHGVGDRDSVRDPSTRRRAAWRAGPARRGRSPSPSARHAPVGASCRHGRRGRDRALDLPPGGVAARRSNRRHARRAASAARQPRTRADLRDPDRRARRRNPRGRREWCDHLLDVRAGIQRARWRRPRNAQRRGGALRSVFPPRRATRQLESRGSVPAVLPRRRGPPRATISSGDRSDTAGHGAHVGPAGRGCRVRLRGYRTERPVVLGCRHGGGIGAAGFRKRARVGPGDDRARGAGSLRCGDGPRGRWSGRGQQHR